MSSGGGTSTQTTVQELSPEQRKLIEPVIPIATDFLKNPPKMYPGSGIVGFNPLQNMAQQMTLGAAQSMLPMMSALPQQLQGLMGGWGSTVNAAGRQGAAGQNQLNAILGMMGGQASGINPMVQGQSQDTLNALNSRGRQTIWDARGVEADVGRGITAGNRAMAPGLNFLTGGDVLDPNTNRFLSAAIQAASRPAVENFQNVIMPSLAGENISAGGFGGSRQGIAEGLAAQGLSRAVGDISANMGNAGYQAGLQAMTQGLGMQQAQGFGNLDAMIRSGQLTQNAAQQMMQSILAGGQLQQAGTLGAAGLEQNALANMMQGNIAGQGAAQNWMQTQQAGLGGLGALLGNQGNILQQGLLPAQLTEAVGSQQQMMQQAQLTERVQRFVNEQMMPFMMAQDVAAMAFGMPGGTTRTTATGGGNNGAMQGIQTGIGALSAIAPLLAKSDRRLKKDIEYLYTLWDGLKVYSFKLWNESVTRTGLMADEVMELYPLAVVDLGRFKAVRYDLVPSWHTRAYRRY